MHSLSAFSRKTCRFLFILAPMLLITSKALGNGQGRLGSYITYSMPHNLIGFNIHSSWTNGFGFYSEMKMGLSGPSTARNEETFLNISGGLLKRMNPKILIYFGGGGSLRLYLDPPGSARQAIDPARLNLSGGIIIVQQGSGFLHDLLSYQFGFDTRPLGVSIGVGLHFKLPFLKRFRWD